MHVTEPGQLTQPVWVHKTPTSPQPSGQHPDILNKLQQPGEGWGLRARVKEMHSFCKGINIINTGENLLSYSGPQSFTFVTLSLAQN